MHYCFLNVKNPHIVRSLWNPAFLAELLLLQILDFPSQYLSLVSSSFLLQLKRSKKQETHNLQAYHSLLFVTFSEYIYLERKKENETFDSQENLEKCSPRSYTVLVLYARFVPRTDQFLEVYQQSDTNPNQIQIPTRSYFKFKCPTGSQLYFFLL